MKKLLVVGFLMSSFWAKAQLFEGKIQYLVTQDWTKKLAAVSFISKQQKERSAYMWGNRSSWKNLTELYVSPTSSRYEESEEKAEPDNDNYAWRKTPFGMNRDFQKNTMLDQMELLDRNYVIEDSLQLTEWRILNDLKEVAGHICMKAATEDTLRKQKIVAWFAQDISSSAGPDRFCGLPGLILEVDINDGAKVIEARKIEVKKLTTELDLPQKMKGKRVKSAEFQALLKKHIDEKTKAEEFPFWGIPY